jgi:GTP-binding protein
MREHWGELLSDYFRVRQSLKGLLLIVDIRRQLRDYDRQMMAFAEEVDLPIHILLTKADKLKRGQAARALLEVCKEVADRATVQQFSALSRQGEDEAREVLERYLTAST